MGSNNSMASTSSKKANTNGTKDTLYSVWTVFTKTANDKETEWVRCVGCAKEMNQNRKSMLGHSVECHHVPLETKEILEEELNKNIQQKADQSSAESFAGNQTLSTMKSRPRHAFTSSLTLEGLREKVHAFADERDWHQVLMLEIQYSGLVFIILWF